MTCSKKIPLHTTAFGQSWVFAHKIESVAAFELRLATIREDNVVLRSYSHSLQPYPVQKEAMLYKEVVIFFVIADIKMSFLQKSGLICICINNHFVHNVY
jgi:hypothetical protein